jgi:uncharacterized repeat protein (TIGR01451 family)
MKNLPARIQTSRGLFARLAPIVLLNAVFIAAPFHAALAQIAPTLGTAQNFAVLGSSTVTNTGPTIVTGDLGVDPGTAITGFPPGTVVGGTTHAADAVALQAQSDTTTAYVNLAGQLCNTSLTGTDLGGLTLVPGVYCFSSSAQLTGKLTLDAGGNPSAVWVFQIGSTLTTASSASVVLINGGQLCNVFWQVGSSATIGTSTNFIGNILALTSITITTNASVSGRALARNGAVTMDSNVISISACGAPPVAPTLGKAFSPAAISAGGVSTLTITLGNASATADSLTAPLIDTLPTGVVIASTPNVATTCGGTPAASAGGTAVTLTGGSILGNSSCTLTVDVTAPAGGNFINSLAAGALQTNGGTNAAPAVATLTVSAPSAVTLGKAFSAATINAGGISTLTITLTNAGATVANLSAPLTDNLPSGVVVSGNAATTCSGTLTSTASTVTLTGGSIQANSSCTVTVDVTAPAAGSYFNLLPAGALQTDKGNNTAPAIATLTVSTPSSITVGKAFSPATINAGGLSTLTITLSNSGSTASLTAPLTDTLPSGVFVAGSVDSTCIPPLTGFNRRQLTRQPRIQTVAFRLPVRIWPWFTSGPSTVSMTGGSIPAGGSCTITVLVTAPVAGTYLNTLTAGALQTDNGSNTAPAVATLTVHSFCTAPTLSKSFSPATIKAGGTSTLTITLNNPDNTIANLTAPLTDFLPSGVVVAGSVSSDCIPPLSGFNMQPLTTQPRMKTVAFRMPARMWAWFDVGRASVSMTGGSIPADGSCTITVLVTVSAAGSYINKLPAGALQTNLGSNTTAAIATLIVSAPVTTAPALSKSFSPSTIKAGKVSTLTITLDNPDGTIAKLTAPLTDNLPSNVLVSSNASTTCGGTVTASNGGSTVTLTKGSIPANGSCTVTVDVTANYKGTCINTLPVGALQTTNGSNIAKAVATLTVSASHHHRAQAEKDVQPKPDHD